MNFEKDITPFLQGKKFSNGIKVKIANAFDPVVSKIDFLKQVVKGKNVLHIGFADHVPLIEEKMKNNTWIHNVLINNSKKCVGVDIDSDAVQYVKEKFGVENIHAGAVIRDENLNFITEDIWDYAVLGDVLEHIDNPVLFLKALNEKYGKFIKCLIITVPNAWELINLRLLFKQQEYINTDHRFWFTPFTLAKVAIRAGWEVEDFHYIQNGLPKDMGLRSIIFRYILRKYPATRETVVIKLLPGKGK